MDVNTIIAVEMLLIVGSLLTFAACEVREARRSPARAKIKDAAKAN